MILVFATQGFKCDAPGVLYEETDEILEFGLGGILIL